MEWEIEGEVGYDPLILRANMLVIVLLAALGVFLNAVILRKAGRSPLWAVLFLPCCIS